LVLLLTRDRWKPQAKPAPTPRVQRPVADEPVAALGRLEPAGDIRVLAAPIIGTGGSPRLKDLLVEEGQRVAAGSVLARFDNGPSQRAEHQVLSVRIRNLERRLAVDSREIDRYRRLAAAGAIAIDELDRREQIHLLLQGQLQEARAQLIRVDSDLVNTELKSPINGTVLSIHSRVGERPGDKGVLEIGDSDRMEAMVEVYESDINRVQLGQRASLTSENGGFKGTLSGIVTRISPQVRQRDVLSTDPTGDADARVVEVRVRLEANDAQKVAALTGLKVIARFQP
jgi:HlyD family secretion protein